MAHRIRKVAGRAAGRVLLACAAGCAFAAAQTAIAQQSNGQSSSAASSSPSSQSSSSQSATQNSSSPDANQEPSTDDGYSSSKKGHHNSAAHHIEVPVEDSPPPELAQAEDLIQKQDFAGAEPLLHKVVESDPANYVAWFDLGFVDNGLGRVDDSIAAYRKSVASKPDVFESNLNLGLQLAKTGQPDAEQFLRAATQLKPTSHVEEGQERAWLSLAHMLEASRPEEAIGAYAKAATLQPKDPEPHLAAGLVFEKEQKFSDAEGEYKQALALDSSADSAASDALTGLANIYMRGRRLPEAEAVLRRLVMAHPAEASPHVQLGRVLAAEGKNEDAIAELQTGTKLDPGDASLQRDLADLYSMAKKNDQAEAAYRALLAGSPNDAELHDSLGKSLLEQKKFLDAQKEFLLAVKLKPDLGPAYGDLAFAASENKDYGLTIKSLDTRVKFLPEIPITYFLRASAYDHLKDVKHAAANYHLFLSTADGKYPDQEWQAKHRLMALEPKR